MLPKLSSFSPSLLELSLSLKDFLFCIFLLLKPQKRITTSPLRFLHATGAIADNSIAYVAIYEYHHYKEDIDILKKMNCDAYRFSISWSMIFPEMGKEELNLKG